MGILRRSMQNKKREIVLLILCALVLAGFALAGKADRAPLASAETRFVERSASGLQIVPASCPSAPPHFYGDTGLPNCSAGGADGAAAGGGGAGGGGSQSPTYNLLMYLYVSPDAVSCGQEGVVSWTSSGGEETCEVYGPSGLFGSGTSGDWRSTGPLLQSATYKLWC